MNYFVQNIVASSIFIFFIASQEVLNAKRLLSRALNYDHVPVSVIHIFKHEAVILIASEKFL